MNKKYFYLSVALITASLMSCTQKQGPSEAEIQKRIDAAVQTALKEKASAEAASSSSSTASPSSSTASSSSSTTSSSSSSTSSLKQEVYQLGYQRGMIHHTIGLDHFTDDNEKRLKKYYIEGCQYGDGGLSINDITNRELYNVYRSGFLKGHDDGNNALN